MKFLTTLFIILCLASAGYAQCAGGSCSVGGWGYVPYTYYEPAYSAPIYAPPVETKPQRPLYYATAQAEVQKKNETFGQYVRKLRADLDASNKKVEELTARIEALERKELAMRKFVISMFKDQEYLSGMVSILKKRAGLESEVMQLDEFGQPAPPEPVTPTHTAKPVE